MGGLVCVGGGVGGSFFCFGGQIPYCHYKGSSTKRRGFTLWGGVIFFVLGVRFHIFITRGQAPIEGGLQGGGGVIFLFRGSNAIFSLQRVKHQ